MESLYVKDTGRYGRGVFAKVFIPKGELIEKSPVIVISKDEWKTMRGSILRDYIFNWGDNKAIALGFGSLYNHSYEPNAKYITNIEEGTIDFYARKDIYAGEEIFVNYNGDPLDQSELWFDVKE